MKHLILLCSLALPQIVAAHPGHAHLTPASFHIPAEFAMALLLAAGILVWRGHQSLGAKARARSDKR
ncbi:MAG: hypothetical protein AAF436_08860 [Myxococcota bacterium]